MKNEKNVNLQLTNQQLDDLQSLISPPPAPAHLSEEQQKEKIQIVKSINQDVANLFNNIFEQVAECPDLLQDKEAVVDRKDKFTIWGSSELEMQMKVLYSQKKVKKK